VDLGLKGRVAAITAASKGLGRACALALAAEGCEVAICARGEEALRATEQDIAALGVRVHAVTADVDNVEDCRRFVDGAASALGRLDVLVPISGGPPPGPFEAHDDHAWTKALEGNLLSVVRLSTAAVPHMRRGGWGRIVAVTSISAKQPIDGLILSNASRAGATGFLKTLATELAAEGITVNNVLPGSHLTDRIRSLAQEQAVRAGTDPNDMIRAFEAQIPMRRLGRPEELAAVVTFLASEQAAFVTGASIQVDGGASRGLL
jgi:3-oxoacyl-[acyl-carrier protein] reductase